MLAINLKKRALHPGEKMIRILLLAGCFAIVVAGSTDELPTGSRIPPGAKVYVAGMKGGLHGFIATEILKKRIPEVVVTEEGTADYILTGGSIKGDDRWYHPLFGGKDKNEGNVQLISVRDKQLVWASEAGDRSLWWGGLRHGGQP